MASTARSLERQRCSPSAGPSSSCATSSSWAVGPSTRSPGAPGLSRGLLSKRLRELERAGVLEIRPKPDGPGSTLSADRSRPGAVRGHGCSPALGFEVGGTDTRTGTPRGGALDVGHVLPGPRAYATAAGPGALRLSHPVGARAVAVGCSSNWATPRSARSTRAAKNISSWWSTIRSRSHAGIWARSSGSCPATRAIELRGSRTLARALPTWHRDHERGPQPLHPVEPASDYTNQVAVAAPA